MDTPGGYRLGPDDPVLVGTLLDCGGDDPRRPDPVAAHHDRPLGAGLVEVGRPERDRVAGAELEDVADLDRGLDLDRAAARRDVARLDDPDVHLLELEVAAGLDPAQVRVGPVRAGDVGAGDDRRVLDDLDLGSDRAEEPDRADLGLDLLASGGPEIGAERVAELDLVEAMVAADQDDHHAASVDQHRQGLDQGAGGQSEVGRDLVDRRQAGGLDLLRGGKRLGELDRLRIGRGDLDVGRVARGERHLVLARRAGGHVLVGAGAAHHPDIGLDPVPAQAAAVEDPRVRLALEPVGTVEALLVAVEGVGVLHQELAGPQHPRARPRLVALLGLDVEKHQRQVAVGADLAGDVVRHALLVGHREDHRRPPAVLELEQLVDRVAARLLPVLGRLEDGHQHLLASDRLHLLAQDLLDLADRAPPGREVGPEPGAELADQPGPHHQPVRGRLGVGGRVPQRRYERLAPAGHAGNLATRRTSPRSRPRTCARSGAVSASSSGSARRRPAPTRPRPP